MATSSSAWADDEDDAPPGFEKPKTEQSDDAPPGFEEEASKLADDLKTSAKVGLDVDEPDLTLRLAQGLREGIAEAQITTQSETMYASASRFEDLPLSPEILEGLYGEMKFERPSKIQAITLPMVSDGNWEIENILPMSCRVALLFAPIPGVDECRYVAFSSACYVPFSCMGDDGRLFQFKVEGSAPSGSKCSLLFWGRRCSPRLTRTSSPRPIMVAGRQHALFFL